MDGCTVCSPGRRGQVLSPAGRSSSAARECPSQLPSPLWPPPRSDLASRSSATPDPDGCRVRPMQIIKGIPVSPGIVVGRALHVGRADQHVPQRIIAPGEIDAELARLQQSLQAASHELEELRDRTHRELGAEPAKIFGFHLGLLKDPSLLEIIRNRIRNERVNAEHAVADQFQSLATQFLQLGSEVFEQKANDVVDLERRILGKLMGEAQSRLASLKESAVIVAHELTPSQTASLDRTKVIAIATDAGGQTGHTSIVAHELTPSQTASLDRTKVIAIATDAGGQTGHTSIVARALGLPAVVGCQRATEDIEDGDLVLVDGDAGVLIVRPDPTMLEEYRGRAERGAKRRRLVLEEASRESATTDGTKVSLLGNIEFPEEVEAVLANGGDGVGLFRTEFLY
ncbi:MAG: phosphoenolpyruvate--protein phosphotransferase, partial [Phycisphaerae bacterium]|nr:phosphoenolpyruvate--protein phosphotransferase [Phycisphaerae bacterium]